MSTNREPGVGDYRRLAMGAALAAALSAAAVVAVLPSSNRRRPATTPTETTRLHTANRLFNETDEQLVELRARMSAIIAKSHSSAAYSEVVKFQGNRYRSLVVSTPDSVETGKYNVVQMLVRPKDGTVFLAGVYDGSASRHFDATTLAGQKCDFASTLLEDVEDGVETMDLETGPVSAAGVFSPDPNDHWMDGQKKPAASSYDRDAYGQFILQATDLLYNYHPVLS